MYRARDVQVSAANAAITATVAAVPGNYLHVVGITLSYSDAPIAGSVVEMRDGAVVLDKWVLPNMKALPMPLIASRRPLFSSSINTAFNVVVPALGAGVITGISLRVIVSPDREMSLAG